MIEWESLTPNEKAACRELGEYDPLTFMRVWFQVTQGEKLKINWHHRLFNLIASEIISGKRKNEIINTPPGSTKTEFWSIHLPAYCFAKFPKVRILNTSYSKSLVEENSERTRALIRSGEWQECYRHDIAKDRVDDWTINSNGKRVHQLFSRSSGGQITGVRGGYMTGDQFSGYLTMDDWDKPDDLFSEVRRLKAHKRASNTLRSRRADPLTPVIAIQQRLHVDDITGFLLGGGMGMQFNQTKIPALINDDYIQSLPAWLRDHCWNDIKDSECAEGYYSFFPAKEDVRDLLALRDSDSYTFMSQYMQEPESLTGGVFRAESYGYYTELDDDLAEGVERKPDHWEYRFITADTAQKTAEHNDYSVFMHWGVYQGRVYLVGMIRGKWESPELKQNALSFIAGAVSMNDHINGRLRCVLIEDKASGTGLIQEIKHRCDASIEAVQRVRDKFTRAMDVQSHHRNGCVVLPYGYEHNLAICTETAAFSHNDTHQHDDIIDNIIDAIDYVILSPYSNAPAINFMGLNR